jgi:predicted TIM-barrel fold metal-dependent hydrolase
MFACDAHAHVWTPDTASFPTHASHPLPASLASCGSHVDLLAAMDATSVHSALLVQPVNYMFDHSYLLSAARAAPGRLSVVALADVAAPPDEARAAVRRLASDGAVGVRVNPNLATGKLADASVASVLREAGALDIPAALFVSGMDGVEELVAAHAATSVVLDHFAIPFVEPGRQDAELQRLIDVGRRYANVYVKASALFRVSTRPYPHTDRQATLVSLVQALGADRVLFGSDFPFSTEGCTYAQSWRVLREDVPLNAEDTAMVAGGTAAKLYGLPVAAR